MNKSSTQTLIKKKGKITGKMLYEEYVLPVRNLSLIKPAEEVMDRIYAYAAAKALSRQN